MEAAFTRLNQAIEYLKDNGKIHKQQDIADALGMAKTHLSVALRGGKYFTEGFLKRFAKAYSDFISEDWLLTGEGRMEAPDKSMRPHVEAKAAAGFMGGVASGEYECEMRAPIVGVTDYDFTIDVEGDSMTPAILEGDCLACSIDNDTLNPPVGKICVVDTRDGAVVKVIAAVSCNSITLHSINPDYEDYKVAHSEINRIARVVGLVRNFN